MTLKTISFNNVDGELCKLTNKWGIHLHWHTGDYETSSTVDQFDYRTAQASAPFLSEDDALNLVIEKHLWVFADTEEEIYALYEQIYGDDTEKSDETRISMYATLFDPKGEFVTENS